MPTDNFKPKGPVKSDSADSGGADAKKYPVIGIVKDNIDSTRTGRISVALQDGKGSLEPDEGPWTSVQHLSTFFGSVRPSAGSGSDDYGSYKTNPSAYGQWQAPPDIGTKVVCIFVNGDPDAGYYIGAISEPETLQMVPAIGSSESVTLNEGEAKSYGGATRLPVTNLNTNNTDKADSNEFLNTPRPVHSYTASIMSQQGIIRDPVRGPISSSAQREAASRVGWGVSTPGRPIYEGGYNDENLPENLSGGKSEQLKVVSRRGGHSIVMDDGDIIGRDQLIRIRTSLGHQILMSDDGQTLMLLHSNGQSYIELGKEGTVDVFAMNSINLRTQGDFNIHADRDVNIQAMENLNIQAKNIHTNSEEETKSRAGTEYRISALTNFTAKAGFGAAIKAGGEASLVGGAIAVIKAKLRINLNSGSPILKPKDVPIIPLIAQTDTLFDKEKGWAAAPAKLLTIASRTPAHYPWANAGQGVDVKVSGDASDNLPSPPSAAVQAVNKAAEDIPATPPSVATVASVPPVAAVSETLDKTTTDAVLGSSATSAAEGPGQEAVTSGAAIVSSSDAPNISGITSALGEAAATVGGVSTQVTIADRALTSLTGSFSNNTIAMGSFAQTPTQLTTSGILKPGTATLINGLASSGKNLTSTTPDILFAGKPGAENINMLAENTTAQAASLVSVLKVAQQQLNDVGILSGKEASTQSAGLVTAAASFGTDAVIDTVRDFRLNVLPTSNASELASRIVTTDSVSAAISSSQALRTNVTDQLSTLNVAGINTGTVLSTIGKGISAANLASTLGGLGGIANSLKSVSGALGSLRGGVVSLTSLLSSVRGVSGSAYAAILAGFAKLEPNVPQYLSEFAKKTSAISTIVSRATSSPNSGSSLNSLGNTLSSLASNATSLANDIQTAERVTNSIENTFNNSIDSITGIGNNIGGVPARLPNTINGGILDNVLEAQPNANASLSTLIDSVSGTNDQQLIDAVSNSTDMINSMAGASTALASGGLTSLANAARVTQSGGGAASASALASGLSNLPGGIRTVSTVTNSAANAINSLPGTSILTGEMRNIQTQVLNGLSTVSSVANSLGSFANRAGGLTSAITSRLPLGQASQLLSSLSALGAGGASPIKLPSIGINTINRQSLTAQIKSVIGDPGIPEPNLLGEISESTIESFEQELLTALEDIKKITDELNAALQEENTAYARLTAIERDAPFGDPSIAEARRIYIEATNKSSELMEQYIKLTEADSTTINTSNTGLV
jgi:hypothetical protein